LSTFFQLKSLPSTQKPEEPCFLSRQWGVPHPHPGFVVLDSPWLTYYEPEGEEDSLEGTDLKDRFYEYLAYKHNDSQIIIIENQPPSADLSDKIMLTDFTKNPSLGRYGFFPR